ncbi:MAG: universal stress protein [Thermodesulfobacteriota bacterium]|nr:universal stress protein [Thermodesulfobacteriota bacterium]
MTTTLKTAPKTILWLVDLSREPQEAFQNIEEFKEAGSEIHILYVGDDIAHHPSWYGDLSPAHAETIHDRSSEKARERLDQICEQYLLGCPLYIRHSSVGDPVEYILTLFKKESFDLVVVPSRLKDEYQPFQSGEIKPEGKSPVPVMLI